MSPLKSSCMLNVYGVKAAQKQQKSNGQCSSRNLAQNPHGRDICSILPTQTAAGK